MDMSLFKLDIDELINEFVQGGFVTLADMKKVWLSRKLSYIFDASPSTRLTCFMQSLYAHAIGHMVQTGSLSKRLAGLYCLYCLYETQPFKPPIRIYLSLGELRKLKTLVVDAKEEGVNVASALVKRMLEKNVFLFGFVDLNEGRVSEVVNQLTKLQNDRMQFAYEKLFADTRIEQFLHVDLGMEFDLNTIKKISTDYSAAKRHAIKVAGKVVDVQNIQHISEDGNLIGDELAKITEKWNVQRKMFNQETESNPYTVQEGEQQNEKHEVQDHDDYDEFIHQLELQLNEEPQEQQQQKQQLRQGGS